MLHLETLSWTAIKLRSGTLRTIRSHPVSRKFYPGVIAFHVMNIRVWIEIIRLQRDPARHHILLE
jgi:hypothetical protein